MTLLLSQSSHLGRGTLRPSSPLPKLVGFLRRVSKGQTLQEQLKTSCSKEDYCRLIEEVLFQAQEDFPGLRQELALISEQIIANVNGARELETAKSSVAWRLRQLAKEKKLPPQVLEYLRQQTQI